MAAGGDRKESGKGLRGGRGQKSRSSLASIRNQTGGRGVRGDLEVRLWTGASWRNAARRHGN